MKELYVCWYDQSLHRVTRLHAHIGQSPVDGQLCSFICLLVCLLACLFVLFFTVGVGLQQLTLIDCRSGTVWKCCMSVGQILMVLDQKGTSQSCIVKISHSGPEPLIS